MNTERLQQIIDRYLEKFDIINGPEYMEYYKWQIAFRFRDGMDEALAAVDEELPAKLYALKVLSSNLIDSYTQPFKGLSEFAKREPQTVRNMLKDLCSVSAGTVKEKQTAIDHFLTSSHALRDTYFPKSFMYKDDLHSVTGYLFLYDPEHNYLYKSTHCRDFADCIEFYDDWGSGVGTRLDIFFRMCDEVLPYLKQSEALAEADSRRLSIDPDGMHSDREKHILLFDLIYCCTSYNLLQGIHFVTPKTGERQMMQKRREKAIEYSHQLEEAKSRLALLEESEKWLQGALLPNTEILHKAFGNGVIIVADAEYMLIQFQNSGQKKLGTRTCFSKGYVRFIDTNRQEALSQRLDLLRNDTQIRNEVRWAEEKLAPYVEYIV